MNTKVTLAISIAGFILLIGITVIAYNALQSRVNPNGIITDERTETPAPDFRMTDWEGNTVRLSDFIANGKPIVINFWASWCPPCVIEMPDFNRVYLDMGDQVQFMMVDVVDGMRETVAIGKRFIEEHNFSFPVFFDTMQEGARTYGIRSIPTTLFIDQNGYIVTGVQGMINEETLRTGIGLITP